MNLDSVVRETLHSYAAGAPAAAGLLDAARSRARRRRIRHTAVAVVAAALVIGAVPLAAKFPYGASTDGPVVPESRPRSVTLVAPSFELPSFPFTPGWVPDGVESPLVFYNSNLDRESSLAVPDGYSESWVEDSGEPSPPRSDLTLSHIPEDSRAEPPLWVSVYSTDVHPYFRSIAVDQEELAVQDRQATRYVFGDGSELIAWRHPPDQWVTVAADEGMSRDDIERYANSFTEDPLPVSMPFTVELLPAEMDLMWTSYRHMSFADTSEGWLDISLRPAEDRESSPQPGQVNVDGRPATLTEGGNGSVLVIPLGQGLVLELMGTLNGQDLLRVAQGIDLTSAARVP